MLPLPKGHLPLLRKRKCEMAFFCRCAQPIAISQSGRGGASGAQTEHQAGKHCIASCFGPAARRRGKNGGIPPEKSPHFRRKIPEFRQKCPLFCRWKGRKTVENAFFFRVSLANCERCRTFAIANGKQARCHNERPQRNTPSLMKKQVDRMCNGEVAELVDALL